MSEYVEAPSAEVDQRFAERVRSTRERAGWSQEDLAGAMRRRCNVAWHQSTVAKVEAGDRAVKLAEAVALARVLSVDLDVLVGDGETEAQRHLRFLMAEFREARARAEQARVDAAEMLRRVFETARETPGLEDMGELGAFLLHGLSDPDPDLWIGDEGDAIETPAVFTWADGRSVAVRLGGDWS